MTRKNSQTRRFLTLTGATALAGIILTAGSYLASLQLDEANAYTFPESIGRHYAKNMATPNGTPVDFKQSLEPTAAITSLEIETVAIKIELLPSADDRVDLSLSSNRVNEKEPVLVDTSRAGVMRVMTQEPERKDKTRALTAFSLTFSNDAASITAHLPRNVLQVKVPKSVKDVRVHTVSGDIKVATPLDNVHAQTKSADLDLIAQPTAPRTPLVRLLKMETVSGDLEGPGLFEELHFNSVSGDIKLHGLETAKTITAQSVSGDLKFETLAPLNSAITFSSTSGKVEIEEANGTKRTIPRGTNPIVLDRADSGATKISFTTVSGSIKLEREHPDHDNDDD
ncbi:MAG: DUF4097 family beta strand repeat-containing protein [Bdellovibrionales bacterium]|jgi:hypothetical protein|nr:DUF4097 family beta strand repeat-containing protein [Bdellovibrionales bacterium]